MTKTGKTILAVSIFSAVILVASVSAGVVVCKKIYEKKYFSAN